MIRGLARSQSERWWRCARRAARRLNGSTGSDGGGGGGGGGGNSNPPSLSGCARLPRRQPDERRRERAAPQRAIGHVHPSDEPHQSSIRTGEMVGRSLRNSLASRYRRRAVAFSSTPSWGNTESDRAACSGSGGKFCYPIPTDARSKAAGARPSAMIVTCCMSTRRARRRTARSTRSTTRRTTRPRRGWLAMAPCFVWHEYVRPDQCDLRRRRGPIDLGGTRARRRSVRGRNSTRNSLHNEEIAKRLHSPCDARSRRCRHVATADGIAPSIESVLRRVELHRRVARDRNHHEKYGLILADNGSDLVLHRRLRRSMGSAHGRSSDVDGQDHGRRLRGRRHGPDHSERWVSCERQCSLPIAKAPSGISARVRRFRSKCAPRHVDPFCKSQSSPASRSACARRSPIITACRAAR